MTTGLRVFDTTIQETNLWLKEVETFLPECDRAQAYHAFRAVTHAVRDRLPLDMVLSLSAQLPILLRGVFLEGWRASAHPERARDLAALADVVALALPPDFPHTAAETVRGVFAALGAQLDPGETRKIVTHLPAALQSAWPFEHQTS
ncbi:MAG: DUF2267 domain-containing protein [Proteobacteria bacterium]|nr:DUF2267 domain-containing protein [Pseudomonadota bacterium]